MTACFDRDGNRVEPEGVCPVYDTGSAWPTFAIVRPAVDNTRVDMSPYGQSVFADAVDAIQAVDLCYDAMMSEIDNGKMRVFLSDVMFDTERDGKGGRVSIPLGRQDMDEVATGLLEPWEYRRKWYGEDGATARGRARRPFGSEAVSALAARVASGRHTPPSPVDERGNAAARLP